MAAEEELEGAHDDPWDDDLREMVAYLRRAAQSELRNVAQPAPDATSLVNRAVVRLLGGRERFRPKDAEHLRRTAARAIRFVLRDHLRQRKTAKSGAAEVVLSMGEMKGDIGVTSESEQVQLESWLDAIEGFSAQAPKAGEIVEAIYLLGLAEDQIARSLGVAPAEIRAADLLFADYCKRQRA